MSALRGADIVCFSNDWGGDPLSKTHLMRLAARENRVLWVNSVGNRAPRATARDLKRIGRKVGQVFQGVREVEPNLYVTAPLSIPVFGQRWARELNATALSTQVRWAMSRLGFRSPIVISFLPGAAPAVDRLGARFRIYYCVDEFSAFAGAGAAIAELERELIGKSDFVICSAQKLLDHKKRMHSDAVLVRHGVDVDHFGRAFDPAFPTHPTVAGLRKPVLAFMGLIAEWVDVELLAALADHYAHGTLLLIGDDATNISALRARPNVVALGRRPYAELPSLLKGVDVGLVAFRDNELTRAANPLKAREYLAAGLPVVSTPIPEVESLDACRIARGASGFIEAIDQILAAGAGPSELRGASMRTESWESRWEHVAELIATRLTRDSPSRMTA